MSSARLTCPVLRGWVRGSAASSRRPCPVEHAPEEEHLQDNLSVGDLAGLVDLSRFQFARRFKQSTGATPHAYVMDERVARAKTLLRRTGIPLAEVAHQCGFANQSHMNRLFGGPADTTPGHPRAPFREPGVHRVLLRRRPATSSGARPVMSRSPRSTWGPMRPVRVPRRTSMVTPATACTPPKSRVTSTARSTTPSSDAAEEGTERVMGRPVTRTADPSWGLIAR